MNKPCTHVEEQCPRQRPPGQQEASVARAKLGVGKGRRGEVGELPVRGL